MKAPSSLVHDNGNLNRTEKLVSLTAENSRVVVGCPTRSPQIIFSRLLSFINETIIVHGLYSYIDAIVTELNMLVILTTDDS